MSPGALSAAAERLGCEEAAMRAVWEVESAGRGFRADGSLERRFEPHKLPGATTTWRDSLPIPRSQRDRMFEEAYLDSAPAALRATSWGAPQIMGFNARAAGFNTAAEMVQRLADDEDEHVWAFVRLIQDWGLRPALVAHDWRAFAARYNGPGQVDRYAGLLEAAYRRHSGQASPAVLRFGDRGPAVKRLQVAMGLHPDGVFGPETQAAVTAWQERAGLTVDGIVGRRTWDSLEARVEAKPLAQPTRVDGLVTKARDVTAVGGAVGGAAAAVERVLPADAYQLLAYGAVCLLLLAGAVAIYQRMVRRT
jgi:hypothetical protein